MNNSPALLLCCVLALPALAAAQPLKIFEDDEEKKEFVEREIKLPPAPKAENLVKFEASAANSNNFFIDATSILISDDGVVRYTMVVKSPSGAENVSYEGIRCETTELKVYAYGRRDGTWSNATAPAWKKIVYKDVQRQHGVLYSHYFCPDGAAIRSPQAAIQRFKYGVPYGEPPRSSSGKY
jgi:hypothetical protein